MNLLIKRGADVNKSNEHGQTPLHAATHVDTEDGIVLVKALIAHGADVNAKVRIPSTPDEVIDIISDGGTPLHNAAGVSLVVDSNDDFEVVSNRLAVRLLLAHGAKVNKRDAFGCTPIWNAWYAGSLDVMELLIEHGTDINIRNNENGGTILHDVAYDGWLEGVQLLIAHGANIHSRDFNGETPLHRAALGRSMDVVSFLVNHGADVHAASKRNETPQLFLNEPNDIEPILLPSNAQTYAIIVTDGLDVRMKLKSESVDYDTIWFPNNAHVEVLNAAFKSWITQGKYKSHMGYIQPEYILEHFEQYNSEYAGFIKDGAKYIISNKVPQSLYDPMKSPPRNGFSGIMDGGCAQIVFVFNVRSNQIVWSRCNGM